MVVKPGQTIEEDWFSNTECSPSFWRMMNAIANKVELKGYFGWAGGLDTKSKLRVYTALHQQTILIPFSLHVSWRVWDPCLHL
jgi:Rap/ran-GAP